MVHWCLSSYWDISGGYDPKTLDQYRLDLSPDLPFNGTVTVPSSQDVLAISATGSDTIRPWRSEWAACRGLGSRPSS